MLPRSSLLCRKTLRDCYVLGQAKVKGGKANCDTNDFHQLSMAEFRKSSGRSLERGSWAIAGIVWLHNGT